MASLQMATEAKHEGTVAQEDEAEVELEDEVKGGGARLEGLEDDDVPLTPPILRTQSSVQSIHDMQVQRLVILMVSSDHTRHARCLASAR